MFHDPIQYTPDGSLRGLPPSLEWAIDPSQRTRIHNLAQFSHTINARTSALGSHILGFSVDASTSPLRSWHNAESYEQSRTEFIKMSVKLVEFLKPSVKHIHLAGTSLNLWHYHTRPCTLPTLARTFSFNTSITCLLDYHQIRTPSARSVPLHVIYDLFAAPGLRDLEIHGVGYILIDDTQHTVPKESTIATSPVTSLSLLGWNPETICLPKVISWPRALETFYLRMAGRNDVRSRLRPLPSIKAILEVLSRHRASLRELYIEDPGSEYLDVEKNLGPLELDQFQEIRKLGLSSTCLGSYSDAPLDAQFRGWQSLPSKIEELQIELGCFHHINHSNECWCSAAPSASITTTEMIVWLKELVASRHNKCPNLSKINLILETAFHTKIVAGTSWDSALQEWLGNVKTLAAMNEAGIELVSDTLSEH